MLASLQRSACSKGAREQMPAYRFPLLLVAAGFQVLLGRFPRENALTLVNRSTLAAIWLPAA